MASKFVQQQRYQQHQSNKSMSGQMRRIRKDVNSINEAKKEYEDFIQEEVNELFNVNHIENPEFNANSKLAVFKLIEHKLKENKSSFEERLAKAKPEDINQSEVEVVLRQYDQYINNIEAIYDLRFFKNACYSYEFTDLSKEELYNKVNDHIQEEINVIEDEEDKNNKLKAAPKFDSSYEEKEKILGFLINRFEGIEIEKANKIASKFIMEFLSFIIYQKYVDLELFIKNMNSIITDLDPETEDDFYKIFIKNVVKVTPKVEDDNKNEE
jgi:hypothetical protein